MVNGSSNLACKLLMLRHYTLGHCMGVLVEQLLVSGEILPHSIRQLFERSGNNLKSDNIHEMNLSLALYPYWTLETVWPTSTKSTITETEQMSEVQLISMEHANQVQENYSEVSLYMTDESIFPACIYCCSISNNSFQSLCQSPCQVG